MTDTVERTGPDEWGLVDELYPSLRRFAAVTAPPDLDPDDLLQEALAKVLRKRKLSDLDHPEAYLRTTIVNLATTHNRRMARRRRAIGRLAASQSTATTVSYPSDLAELAALPPRERAALYLAEVEGYRFAEIGRLLGCSEAAARKGASRGRQRLRLAMATEESR